MFLFVSAAEFVPYMEKLFDETILLGVGWTANESCRTLAYSTLADLIHHVRQHLPLNHLTTAVHLFSKNIHDESQPTTSVRAGVVVGGGGRRGTGGWVGGRKTPDLYVLCSVDISYIDVHQ